MGLKNLLWVGAGTEMRTQYLPYDVDTALLVPVKIAHTTYFATLCYGALAGTRNSSMGPPHE